MTVNDNEQRVLRQNNLSLNAKTDHLNQRAGGREAHQNYDLFKMYNNLYNYIEKKQFICLTQSKGVFLDQSGITYKVKAPYVECTPLRAFFLLTS